MPSTDNNSPNEPKSNNTPDIGNNLLTFLLELVKPLGIHSRFVLVIVVLFLLLGAALILTLPSEQRIFALGGYAVFILFISLLLWWINRDKETQSMSSSNKAVPLHEADVDYLFTLLNNSDLITTAEGQRALCEAMGLNWDGLGFVGQTKFVFVTRLKTYLANTQIGNHPLLKLTKELHRVYPMASYEDAAKRLTEIEERLNK